MDVDKAVGVSFAEDLSYADVSPLLDAFSAAGVFEVRTRRVAWTGPAGGGPEVALYIVGGIGAAAFAKTFGEELAKDAYKAVRAVVIALARRLRGAGEDRRAVVAVVVEIRGISFPLGRYLHEPPGPDEWTDDWLVSRLRKAQAAVDSLPEALWAQPLKELRHQAEQDRAAKISVPIDTTFYWDERLVDWVPEESFRQMIDWVERNAKRLDP